MVYIYDFFKVSNIKSFEIEFDQRTKDEKKKWPLEIRDLKTGLIQDLCTPFICMSIYAVMFFQFKAPMTIRYIYEDLLLCRL